MSAQFNETISWGQMIAIQKFYSYRERVYKSCKQVIWTLSIILQAMLFWGSCIKNIFDDLQIFN